MNIDKSLNCLQDNRLVISEGKCVDQINLCSMRINCFGGKPAMHISCFTVRIKYIIFEKCVHIERRKIYLNNFRPGIYCGKSVFKFSFAFTSCCISISVRTIRVNKGYLTANFPITIWNFQIIDTVNCGDAPVIRNA